MLVKEKAFEKYLGLQQKLKTAELDMKNIKILNNK